MDPRQQPQLPFSRNPAPPYTNRSPFPPTSSAPSSNPSQSPYPPSSHPPPPNAAYPDQRRSVENPFYTSGPRQYPQDGPSAQHPHPSGGHSRHHSASSLPPTSSAQNRGMPPPGSPPQPGQGLPQQGPPPHQMNHYGLPPPRGPTSSVGPPASFAGGRELPALGQIPRTGSTGSSMSISSMLGGPSASRESQPPQSQYGPPPPATSAPGGPSYSAAIHASPRMHATTAEYQPFRRPQTPDHQRPYDPRADPRGNVAASPQGAYSTTPEMQRYGTPGAFHQRAPSQQDSRESSRVPGGPPPPPRPSSQPKAFSNYQPRHPDMNRPPVPEDHYPPRREEPPRPQMEYNPERTGLKPYGYDDRYRAERERREEMELRERDRRDRAYSGGEGSRPYIPHSVEYRQQEPPRSQGPPFNRPPEMRDGRDPRDSRDPRDIRDSRDPRDDARDPSAWAPRQAYDQSRAPYDPAGYYPRHHEHPPTSAPPYPPHPTAAYAQPQDRYPPTQHAPPLPPPGQAPPYDSPDRARMNVPHSQAQMPPGRRPMEEGPPPPSVAYNPAGHYDVPRQRPGDDIPPPANRASMLAVQEINRKGRISPLPQAVQGAQPQISGPAGEPGIKSEFGRMFSGIGSGVSGIVSSPVSAGAQLVNFGSSGLGRREDLDATNQESGPDAGAKPASKARRRKHKDVEAKMEDDGSGRLTPVSRNKRHKGQHHPHHLLSQVDSDAAAASAASIGIAALKNLKGGTPLPSPTTISRDHASAHGHPVPRPTPQTVQIKEHAKPPPPPVPVVIPPKPKTVVSSKEVLQSVSKKPRHHLGDVVYDPQLQPGRQMRTYGPDYGFASTPKPLPYNMIRDKENCTLTVKIPRVHLTAMAREEITRRRALWGTEVYTDDSDVIAACIHGGWIRGEWADSVDTGLLELDRGLTVQEKDIPNMKRRKEKERDEQARHEANSALFLDKAPKTGPVHVHADRDLHVTLLVLPKLEKYGSTTRFGIQSREFGGVFNGRTSIHDGISFMITAIRWVDNGAGAQSRLRGKGRRERMRRAMAEVKEVNWPDKTAEEPVVHVPGEPLSKHKPDTNGHKTEKAPSEGDKENRPEPHEAQDAQAPPPTGEAPKEPAPVPKENGTAMEVDPAPSAAA
ncbi:histone deacetylation protein Rxt3-domain-containing protein [Plectosphaerella plurivora]|uniref:Histone deacetylation protein Rxt3-domain-containing protein n=1 Tax=Plectosphaerella plurivora TaxID=936078 RepID=A0A9P9A8V1_9PEZI|nr:histone deacetylation protein Rxt3-domain-containing protein [Plectosphaerella plurivora]